MRTKPFACHEVITSNNYETYFPNTLQKYSQWDRRHKDEQKHKWSNLTWKKGLPYAFEAHNAKIAYLNIFFHLHDDLMSQDYALKIPNQLSRNNLKYIFQINTTRLLNNNYWANENQSEIALKQFVWGENIYRKRKLKIITKKRSTNSLI